jgi:pimeloyl-ACP methyl ester carboxylesterase
VDVVYHHGTPFTGRLYHRWLQEGVRLIGFDRPGYGVTPRRRGRTVADVVDDVRALADELGLERFATWGISGGGPHALACAALMPERVTACAVLGSPAPFDADGLDWLAGQGEGNVVEHTAAARGETVLRPLIEQEHAALAAGGAAGLREQMASLLAPPDREALAGELGDHLYDSLGGVDGWLDDDLAFVRPWGFDLGSIGVRVLIRHGEADRFVPVSHARWLAAHIPGAEAHITAADGHLTLYEHAVPAVQDWLRQDGS